jgi:hypothetical protein
LEFGAYRFKASGADAVLHVRELLDVHNGQITASVVTIDNQIDGELDAARRTVRPHFFG